MVSGVRSQLESWLKTIEVKGSVIDVGGLHYPVKGRTKTWEASRYFFLDQLKEYKGFKADFVWDLNQPIQETFNFDIVFCLEVMEYVFNPFIVLQNINKLLKVGGVLYLSTHFLFPHHGGGTDCLRYTRAGISKLLEECGFKILEITPRLAKSNKLEEWLKEESKIVKYPLEIGHLIKAIKC